MRKMTQVGRGTRSCSYVVWIAKLLFSDTSPSHRRRYGVSNRNYAQQHQCTQRRIRRKRTVPPRLGRQPQSRRRQAPLKNKSALKDSQIPDDDMWSFEQMKDISAWLSRRSDGENFEQVIQIIHEGRARDPRCKVSFTCVDPLLK